MKNELLSFVILVILANLISSQFLSRKENKDYYFSSLYSVKKFYISEKGSTFLFDMLNCDDCNLDNYFYPNISFPNHLEDCDEIKFKSDLINSPFNKMII